MRYLLLIVSFAAVLGCSEEPFDDTKQRLAVEHIVADVVLPTLDAVAIDAASMRADVVTLSATPTQDALDDAQAAWRQLRTPWKETDAYSFGPAMDDRFGVKIDQSPIDVAAVEEEIAGTEVLDAAHVALVGANRKGLHAIEYLLFDTRGDNAVLILLAEDSIQGERRRAYLLALADNVLTDATALRDAWSPTGGDYAGHLQTLPRAKSAIDGFVNASVFLSESVAHMRLGDPLGTVVGAAHPELTESLWSDNSITDMRASIRSIRNVYLGSRDATDGTGLWTLVVERHPAVDASVRAALIDADAAMAAIPAPLSDSLVDHAAVVQAAFDAVIGLKRVLATELVSALGVTLSFNDNDGD